MNSPYVNNRDNWGQPTQYGDGLWIRDDGTVVKEEDPKPWQNDDPEAPWNSQPSVPIDLGVDYKGGLVTDRVDYTDHVKDPYISSDNSDKAGSGLLWIVAGVIGLLLLRK